MKHPLYITRKGKLAHIEHPSFLSALPAEVFKKIAKFAYFMETHQGYQRRSDDTSDSSQ